MVVAPSRVLRRRRRDVQPPQARRAHRVGRVRGRDHEGREVDELDVAFEDDEFEVSPFTLDGKEYFKSCDGDIFDSDSMEYLGILRGKKIVPCPASDAVTAFLAKSQ